MTMRIYLESKGVAELTQWGHLYLVRKDDALPPEQADAEALVIRGGPDGSALAIQTGFLNLSEDAYNGTERLSIDITGQIPGGAAAWGSLEQTALGLAGLYPYEYPSAANDREHASNSNATILTVLNSVGIDVRDLINQGDYSQGYPGATALNGTLLGVGSNELVGASANMNSDTVLYGRDGFGDKMKGTDGDDYFYGRGGDDDIFWGGGNDIVYGDVGDDSYDMSESTGAIEMVLYSAVLNGVAEIGAGIEIGDSQTLTYTVEEFILGSSSDTVTISADLSTFLNVNNQYNVKIDAGESRSDGDTVILETIQGAVVNLSDNSLQSGSGEVGLFGFENVIGSAQADTITGDGHANWIDGGAGADIIDGGDGIDVLHFDKTGAGVMVNLAAGTGLGGDAAGDTYSNIEVVIGTNNVDTFIGQLGSGQRFSGGIGNDVFDLSQYDALENAARIGPVIVWGGEGEDIYKTKGFTNYLL